MIKKEDVLKSLSNVLDPDIKKDLVSLNMIKNIKIKDKEVSFDIELTTPACPLKEKIKNDCLQELEKINKEEKIVKTKVKKKVKVKKNITSGIAFVKSTFNNTIVSIADENGNVIAWSSAGSKGFKGSRKSTPYAAQVAADNAGEKAYEQGLRTLSVQVKGPGSGRETALRALQSRGFKIISIKDTTPMPHNGARPPKKRRV